MIKLPQSNVINNRADKVFVKRYYKSGQLCIIAKWLHCGNLQQFWHFITKFCHTL